MITNEIFFPSLRILITYTEMKSSCKRNVVEQNVEWEMCVFKISKTETIEWHEERNEKKKTSTCRWLICWNVVVDKDKFYIVRRYSSRMASVYTYGCKTRYFFPFFSFMCVHVMTAEWWHTHWKITDSLLAAIAIVCDFYHDLIPFIFLLNFPNFSVNRYIYGSFRRAITIE